MSELAVGSPFMKEKVMRVMRSLRIKKELDEKLKIEAEEMNITVSQLIELACADYVKKNVILNNTKSIIKHAKQKKKNQLTINLNIDNPTFKKLVDEVNKKNTTFTQEVLYRLSATLNNPIFEQNEYYELFRTRTNLNQIGNLIKLSLENKLPYDNDLMINAEKEVFKLRNQITRLLRYSRKKTFKGGIKNAKH